MVNFKPILLITMFFILSGCSYIKICPKGDCDKMVYHTKTIEVVKPVYACPSEMLSVQKPERPILFLDLISEDDKDQPGKVVQYYKATIKQLLNYSSELESTTGMYSSTCEGLPSIPLK